MDTNTPITNEATVLAGDCFARTEVVPVEVCAQMEKQRNEAVELAKTAINLLNTLSAIAAQAMGAEIKDGKVVKKEM